MKRLSLQRKCRYHAFITRHTYVRDLALTGLTNIVYPNALLLIVFTYLDPSLCFDKTNQTFLLVHFYCPSRTVYLIG